MTDMGTFYQKLALVIIDKLIIGALILLAGFFLNRLLEKFRGTQELRHEYETLRDQTALRYLERQIEELYSPLLGLIQYAGVVFRVARQKVPEEPQSPEQVEVWCYFTEKYFLPLNSQMSSLIRTKLSLLDSEELPPSFQHFLNHQAQFECLHSLWRDKSISSDEISEDIRWPPQFESDVRTTLDQLRRRHNEYRSRLVAPA